MRLQAAASMALACASLVLFPRPATACSCAKPRVCDAFWDADAVFRARANVTFALGGTQRTEFAIGTSFRGPQRGVIEVLSEGIGGSCDYGFRHGTEYLVFARRTPGGPWKVSACGGTAPIADAQEDLAFAKRVTSGGAPGGRVYGSVQIADLRADGQAMAGSPFSHATVTLQGPQRRTVEADLRGNYTFEDVPPGRYTVTVRVSPGFEPVPPTDAHVRGSGDCVAQSFRAIRKSPKPAKDDHPSHGSSDS